MRRFSIIMILLILLFSNLFGQELRVSVSINTNSLESADKLMYDQLADRLGDIINSTKFTNIHYSERERIPCRFTINITKVDNENNVAELLVQASRPVFDTNYTTSIFIHRDKDMSFDYNSGQQFSFDKNNIDNNLIAVLTFYSYLIIDLNLSSFSLNSGNVINSDISNIISQSQVQQSWLGWKPSDIGNRVALYNYISGKDDETFLDVWYTYHIKGLDMLTTNINNARENIVKAVEKLAKYQKERFSSPLIELFANSKLDEIINIFMPAPQSQRLEIYKILQNIYPTYTDKLDVLKRGKNK